MTGDPLDTAPLALIYERLEARAGARAIRRAVEELGGVYKSSIYRSGNPCTGAGFQRVQLVPLELDAPVSRRVQRFLANFEVTSDPCDVLLQSTVLKRARAVGAAMGAEAVRYRLERAGAVFSHNAVDASGTRSKGFLMIKLVETASRIE